MSSQQFMSHHRFVLEVKVLSVQFSTRQSRPCLEHEASKWEIKITKLTLFSFIAFPLDEISNNWKTFSQQFSPTRNRPIVSFHFSVLETSVSCLARNDSDK